MYAYLCYWSFAPLKVTPIRVHAKDPDFRLLQEAQLELAFLNRLWDGQCYVPEFQGHSGNDYLVSAI
jgi:hypothetical protein